jgi:DNA-binding PadR family transcriptional regulator
MFARHPFEFERRGRMFEKGDFKYVILDILKEKPSHGYEIIRALEDRYYGFYTPSAGTVYPTLQMLEDMGYVKSLEQDGKRIYTITKEGLRFLDDREETVDKIKEQIKVHMKGWWWAENRDEMKEMGRELGRIGRLIARKAQRMDRKKLVQIKEIISHACNDIEAVLEQ